MSSINQKFNNTVSVIPRMGATFVKRNSFLVTRIFSSYTVGLHRLTLLILEPYPFKDIELDISHFN